MTVSQEYPEGGLPLVDSGMVWATTPEGEVKWKTVARLQHAGSFETSVNVRCDGFRVEFSGNVSRFGRPDNLFGFGWRECFARINAVLAHYGLPAFTAGEMRQRLNGRGVFVTTWSGARVSRIDLTANYEAGSADNAHLVMQYLATQHNGRKSGRVLGSGETVDWHTGKGKRARQYWKAYIKFLEMQAHSGVDPRVVEHCKAVGIVRFEGTVRSKSLTDMGAAYLGDFESGWAMGQLIQLFNERAAVMSRAERSTDDLDELPRHLRATARDYLAGMDMRDQMSLATFYRHRNALLTYGIDIAVRNVTPFKPRVRVVELARAEVPSWYQFAA
jgi:II/X family phage/plasmid replication protein